VQVVGVREKARVGAKPETLVNNKDVRINKNFMVPFPFLGKECVHN
jgi:hypothetical protein